MGDTVSKYAHAKEIYPFGNVNIVSYSGNVVVYLFAYEILYFYNLPLSFHSP